MLYSFSNLPYPVISQIVYIDPGTLLELTFDLINFLLGRQRNGLRAACSRVAKPEKNTARLFEIKQ